jgi:hypothetical protein
MDLVERAVASLRHQLLPARSRMAARVRSQSAGCIVVEGGQRWRTGANSSGVLAIVQNATVTEAAAKAVMVVRSVMRPGWGWRRTTVVCPPKTRSPNA